ncbi:MAG: hypothetical protein Ta2E_02650 [Mycoplasmoidaceae bacterium]|nr:MAG: hypothetical protein Ta2E_02650 [Mycoplasmoidaceae bacterium]
MIFKYDICDVTTSDQFEQVFNDDTQIIERIGLIRYSDDDNKYKCVIQYLETDEDNDINLIVSGKYNQFYGSRWCAIKLEIPLYIIVANRYTHLFTIINIIPNMVSFKIKDLKKLDENDFAKWWKTINCNIRYTGLQNNNQKHTRYLINQVLQKNNLGFGVDVDGATFLINEKRIYSLLEYKKTNKKLLCRYNPLYYYLQKNNNGYPKGNFKEWNFLWFLKTKLNINLFLITFSSLKGEGGKCGFFNVIGMVENGPIIVKDIENTNVESYDLGENHDFVNTYKKISEKIKEYANEN